MAVQEWLGTLRKRDTFAVIRVAWHPRAGAAGGLCSTWKVVTNLPAGNRARETGEVKSRDVV